MTTIAPKTFLITGVSSGLGRAFAVAALEAGHRVVGTVRQARDAEAFAALAKDRAHPLILDVTDFVTIPAAVSQAESLAGPIDVLVNNAGYGHEGVLEESSIDDLQRQFAANVYGPVAMMQAVLPGMRERRYGHIINVTSMGGLHHHAGNWFLRGSKFALEGISEALGKEVAGTSHGSHRLDLVAHGLGTVEATSKCGELKGDTLDERRRLRCKQRDWTLPIVRALSERSHRTAELVRLPYWDGEVQRSRSMRIT